MLHTKTIESTDQHGISLVESLVALMLTSLLCLSLTKLHITVVHNTKRAYYQEMAIRAQLSLSEALKSCLGDTGCQQFEIQRWGETLTFGISELEPQTRCPKTMLSKIYWNQRKDSSTLKFSYV